MEEKTEQPKREGSQMGKGNFCFFFNGFKDYATDFGDYSYGLWNLWGWYDFLVTTQFVGLFHEFMVVEEQIQPLDFNYTSVDLHAIVGCSCFYI